MTLQIKWLEQPIDYDGGQLTPHWIFKNCNLTGDALVAFIGGCDVGLEKMVDLVDVRDRKPIHSEKMLHFLGEFFGPSLDETILLQRLFVSLVQQELVFRAKPAMIIRSGNDLYDGDAKLSVSIATASPVSTLIHYGINIVSVGTPVKTKGLADYGINPLELAKTLLETFKHEYTSWREARAKVRPVF